MELEVDQDGYDYRKSAPTVIIQDQVFVLRVTLLNNKPLMQEPVEEIE
jgi:hypothetical protein